MEDAHASLEQAIRFCVQQGASRVSRAACAAVGRKGAQLAGLPLLVTRLCCHDVTEACPHVCLSNASTAEAQR